VKKVNPDIHENADEALVEAVRCENRKMVNFLLKRGANVHARNDFALRLASREGFDAIEELLVKHGASQDVFEEYDNDEDPEHEHSGRYYFGTSKLTPKKRQQIFTEGLARYLVDTRDVTALPRTLRQWCERNEIELERRVRAAILKDAVEKWHEMEAEESDEEEEEFEAESEDEVSSCGSASESEEEEVSESEEEASSDEEEETPVTTTAPTTAAESVSDDESEKSDTESAAESDTDDEEIPVIVPHVIRAPRPPSPRPQEAVA
jgi:hypothetical protein